MNLLGQQVAPLGMGCWAIGGPFFAGDVPLGFAGIDDAQSIRTVHAAYDAGIRIFDTAAVYGAGHAERILGTALKDRPDAIVMTKLGTAMDETSKQMLGNQTDPADVMPAIDASLKRLDRDQIDVMQLHLNGLAIDIARPMFEEMEKARQAGKIRAYGWSTDFPQSAASMTDLEGYIGVQHAMNLFADVPDIQSTVAKHNLIAFLRSPLAMGVLTGKYDQSSRIPEDDVRSVNNDRRDYFHDAKPAAHHLRNLDAIRELLQSDGRSVTQGALCWLQAKSAQNVPIPGARTEKQAQENAGALEFGPLPETTMAEIETLMVRPPKEEPRAR